MTEQPKIIIHTDDITRVAKPAEFDLADQLPQMLGVISVSFVRPP